MATFPAVQSGAARRVEEEFLDLVCADEELLRAEFDAIIAQEWAGRPPPAQHKAASPTPGPHSQRHPAPRGSGASRRPRHPGVGGWRRQRSPPRHTRAIAPNQSPNDEDERRKVVGRTTPTDR
jgi:hypothetical protein